MAEWITEDFWEIFDASRGRPRAPGGREGKKNLAQFFFSGGGSHVSDFHESVPLGKAYEAFSLRHLPIPLDKLQEFVLRNFHVNGTSAQWFSLLLVVILTIHISILHWR